MVRETFGPKAVSTRLTRLSYSFVARLGALPSANLNLPIPASVDVLASTLLSD
jgi:hypothetical protein